VESTTSQNITVLPSCSVGQRRCSQKRCILRGWLFLGRRRLGWLSRCRNYCLCACSFVSPDETAILIDHRVRKEDFAFQVFQVGIMRSKRRFMAP
jgi:hypothetical protein